MRKFHVFVVDDDRQYSRLLSYRLEKHEDCEVSVFHSGEEALKNLDREPDLVLLDVMMPGIGGIETLRRLKEHRQDMPVVMVSAQGIIGVAIEAMKIGAYDYVTKGQDDLVKLDTLFKNVTEKVSLSRELENLRSEVAQKYGMNELIGNSPSMEEVYQLIGKALRGDLTVAILGESGTGKELVARAIHYNSSRKRGPFVVVNCAAIPSELMESEFFGHEKGSFTGAHARKIGKFEQSDGGTLFLDEIGELNLGLQAKLLRALQNREIQRVGGNDMIEFDARVISATNRDILGMIRDGGFREDLYYRLFGFPIPLPPLRERGQDSLLLALHFFREYTKKHQEFVDKKISVEAKKAILDYHWAGNVRELKNTIERAVLIADGDEITPADLMIDRRSVISPWEERSGDAVPKEPVSQKSGAAPTLPPAAASPIDENDLPSRAAPPVIDLEDDSFEVEVGDGASKQDATPADAAPPPSPPNGKIVPLEELKRQAVHQAYRVCGGNVDKAAVQLGIGRATMYRLLKKYDLME